MAKNPKKSQTLSEAKDLLFFACREETRLWYDRVESCPRGYDDYGTICRGATRFKSQITNRKSPIEHRLPQPASALLEDGGGPAGADARNA